MAASALPAHGQAAQWQWVKQAVGPGHSQVKDLAADAEGNAYVVGFFTDTLKLDGIALASHGGSDLFVGKLSPAGRWQWAVAAGSPALDQATGVALDAKGQLFITGSFSQQLQLGQTTLVSRGETDIFVAQLGATGQWEWAAAAGGPAADWSQALAPSSQGGVLVAGQFAEQAAFGPQQAVSQGDTDIFVAQVAPASGWQWVAVAGGAENDGANALATSKEGEVYVTGFFSNAATFGASYLSGLGLDDAFVGKLDRAGRWQWATAGTSRNTAYGLSLASDPAGGVWLAGAFNGVAAFGRHRLASKSGDDGFVAKVTATGSWDWVTTVAGDYLVRLTDIANTEQGLCVAGTFYNTVRAGAWQLASQGKTDMLLGMLDKKGNWLRVAALGSSGADEARSLLPRLGGGVWLGGWHDAGLTVGTAHF